MSDGKDNLDLCALGAAVPNAAELSAEDKAYLVESIKNTLQGLAARHTDVLESLEPKVRKRVEALREIQLAAGPNGSQAMAEFIGSAVPNGVMSFINVGHSAALGFIGDVTGFGQDQQFTAVQMLFRSYEAAEPITRLGLNGSYEFGYSAAVMTDAGSVSGLSMLGGSPFLKPGIASSNERGGAGQ